MVRVQLKRSYKKRRLLLRISVMDKTHHYYATTKRHVLIISPKQYFVYSQWPDINMEY